MDMLVTYDAGVEHIAQPKKNPFSSGFSVFAKVYANSAHLPETYHPFIWHIILFSAEEE